MRFAPLYVALLPACGCEPEEQRIESRVIDEWIRVAHPSGSPDEAIRVKAVDILGRMNTEPAHRAVEKSAIRDTSLIVRRAALRHSWAALGEPELADVAEHDAEHAPDVPSFVLDDGAVKAVCRLGPKAAPMLPHLRQIEAAPASWQEAVAVHRLIEQIDVTAAQTTRIAASR